MARPTKTGLDYFSFDVDFYNNMKVRKIMRACGPSAGSILSCLLCNIYGWKGYYIQWDKDLPFDIADSVGVSEGAVIELVNKAVQVDFFDSGKFEAYEILTSAEIQKRYKSGTIKRSEVIIQPEYVVIEGKNGVSSGRNSVNGVGNTQRKGKESIVKETKIRAKALVVASDDGSKQLKPEYDSLVKSLEGKDRLEIWNSLRQFIQDKKPAFLEPYMDAWNLFAISMKLIKEPQKITNKRRQKFSTRIAEPGFDFLRILEKIKTSHFLKGNNNNNWKVSIEFILDSEENYTKILEGKYD
jgi:hypothetical protein